MNKEYCCVCQSKNRRAGLCDVIPEYLEELKTLRVVLERNSKELEVYRRALKLACSENNTNPICDTKSYKACSRKFGSCGECWECMYLQKASEE